MFFFVKPTKNHAFSRENQLNQLSRILHCNRLSPTKTALIRTVFVTVASLEMATVYRRTDNNSKLYHASYMNRNGKRIRKCTGIADKKAAQDLANHWEAQERLLQYGVRDEQAESKRDAAKTSIDSLLADWVRGATVAGKSAAHIDKTEQRVNSICEWAKWRAVGQIDHAGIVKYLEMRKKQGDAPNTVKHYLVAIRLFCRWLVEHEWLQTDPTERIAKPSTIEDRRIVRRMLLPDEWKWLSKYLADGPDRNAQTACQRYLMYWTAVETGLRSSELRSLTKRSIVFERDPFILCKASLTKNARDARQFISDSLRHELAKLVASVPRGEPLFQPASEYDMAKVLRSDIEGARELWLESKPKKNEDFLATENADGESIDFHALRHTCGAWLVMNGVTLPEVQQIMRHSSITLTIDCYGHLAPNALSSRRNVIGGIIKGQCVLGV